MKVSKNKYIIILKNESAYERLLDKDGYLTNDIEYAWKCNSFNYAKRVLLEETDEPELFEIKPLAVIYEF